MVCKLCYSSTDVANQGATFAIIETKLYVPVVTLSTQDIAKLLQQLKSGFKRTVNWNKHLSNPELLAQKPKFRSFSWTKEGIDFLF